MFLITSQRSTSYAATPEAMEIPEDTFKKFGTQAAGVVIGASAGGITAIHWLLEQLNGNLGCPIIFCLHLHPSQGESLYLDKFFSDRAGFEIKEADEKEKPEPGKGYIAPPNYHLLIERDGSFSLSVEEKVHFSRPSIDVLFESAADSWRQRTIGILLTGANADGAEGLLKIRNSGGLTIAQDPQEAESPQMPAAAIQLNAATHILRLKEIASFLNTVLINKPNTTTQ